MKCSSALSTDPDSPSAFREVIDPVDRALGETESTLAVAFVSAHHADSLGLLASEFRSRRPGARFLGVTGETIVGQGREVEDGPAVALWAIALPSGVTARPVRLSWRDDAFEGLADEMANPDADQDTLLLLGDPFTFPTDEFFKVLEVRSAGPRVVGGMASGSSISGGNRLALDGEIYRDGAVGVRIAGPLEIRTVVSQGCRPIGKPMVVTRAEGNVIKELGRRSAIEVLRETFTTLDEADQALIRQGLHVGRVINEYQEKFGRGDFLIRNVMGADDEGGIGITDNVRVGQTVQFHVRDAATADEDLRTLLGEDRSKHPTGRIAGALLFSCNGRGTRLFPAPDHDATAIREALGPVPVAGFFAMGELGPVGGKNFVHGFTASLAIFAAE